jgi:hypothetical protein
MITLPLMSSDDTLFVDYETRSRHLKWLFNIFKQHNGGDLTQYATQYRHEFEKWSQTRQLINEARRHQTLPQRSTWLPRKDVTTATLKSLDAEEVKQIALMKQLTAAMEELIFVTHHDEICYVLKDRATAYENSGMSNEKERANVETIAKLFGRDNFGCKHQQQQDDGCVVM